MTINGGCNKGKLPVKYQRADEEPLGEVVATVQALSSTVDKAMNILQGHASHMDGLQNMVSVILSKIVMIETTLQKPTKTSGPNLSRGPPTAPKSSKTPVSEQKSVAKSPFSRSKSSSDYNVDNVILIPSDDDDDRDKKKKSKTMCNGQSTYLKGNTSKMKNKLMSKRLSFSNLPTGRHLKSVKIETEEAKTMSKFVETNFVTTPEMKLKPMEEHVSCYVFHSKNDLSEEVFKVETLIGSRREFQSLCPGRIIHNEIMHMMSLKATWIERNVHSPSIWSLPPSFVRDAYGDVEELISKYGNGWMPYIERLKHIYLPIEDCAGNWFLMVVSIDDQVLYHLDPGFESRNISPRQDTIKKMWEVITKMVQTMVQTGHFPPHFLCEVQLIDNWDLAEPVGLVSEGFCQHSAVWVLQWLAMGSSFTPNIHVMIKEDVVRMKVAIDLLLGEHNEYKDILVDKAEKAWNSMNNVEPSKSFN